MSEALNDIIAATVACSTVGLAVVVITNKISYDITLQRLQGLPPEEAVQMAESYRKESWTHATPENGVSERQARVIDNVLFRIGREFAYRKIVNRQNQRQDHIEVFSYEV